MKKITLTLLSLCFTVFFGYSQNLVVNGTFDDGEVGSPVPNWGGFKNRIVNDNIITGEKVGQVENGDGSLFQEFDVTPGETYNVSFDYRWVDVGASPNATMNVRFRHQASSTNLTFTNGQDGFLLDSDLDVWKTGTFSVTVPENITEIRLLFFKANGNKPLNIDNVEVTVETASVNDLQQYNYEVYPNPVANQLHISANETISKIEIFNLAGRKVKEVLINSNQAEISIDHLSQGLYILRSYIGNNMGSSKLIKQ